MLPHLLISRLKTLLGSEYDGVMEVFARERQGSLRLNHLKTDGSDVFAEFTEKGIVVRELCEDSGIYIFDRMHEFAIKGTRAFYDGKIYLQGIASMLPVLALDVSGGERVLDVCAAPGSKTTQIAMLMQNVGQIIALEQNQIRYDKLMYNTRLQGASIVEGVKTDARKYFEAREGEFDRILLDAPCSAEGRILLSNEKSYGFWSLDNTNKKAELQYELLKGAYQLLKKGGTLVYSTCTLAPEENEGVIARLLTERPDTSLESIDLGLSHMSWWKSGVTSFGKQVFPEVLKKTTRILPSDETEGFFIAKIRKN